LGGHHEKSASLRSFEPGLGRRIHGVSPGRAGLRARRGAGYFRHLLGDPIQGQGRDRSEEHTSELQSRRDLVCRLLLEKKNKHGSALIDPTTTSLSGTGSGSTVTAPPTCPAAPAPCTFVNICHPEDGPLAS